MIRSGRRRYIFPLQSTTYDVIERWNQSMANVGDLTYNSKKKWIQPLHLLLRFLMDSFIFIILHILHCIWFLLLSYGKFILFGNPVLAAALCSTRYTCPLSYTEKFMYVTSLKRLMSSVSLSLKGDSGKG